MMHYSKIETPNRIKLPLFCWGINNKQDRSTLNLEKGECADLVNVDLANTTSTRKGYTASQEPQIYTGISSQTYVNVNGTWVENIYLGTHFTSEVPHKVPMINDPSGLLEFYNGRLYSLVSYNGQSTLYCSDAWDIDTMDERHCIVATFDSVGTCIGRTDDGLVICTANHVIYLQGADPVEGGFSQRFLAYYGGIKNTLVRTTGEKCLVTKMQGRICIFTTPQGVCVVGTGGSFLNLSIDTYSYPYSEVACAFLRERDGQVHYIVSMTVTVDPYNAETDNIEITDSN